MKRFAEEEEVHLPIHSGSSFVAQADRRFLLDAPVLLLRVNDDDLFAVVNFYGLIRIIFGWINCFLLRSELPHHRTIYLQQGRRNDESHDSRPHEKDSIFRFLHITTTTAQDLRFFRNTLWAIGPKLFLGSEITRFSSAFFFETKPPSIKIKPKPLDQQQHPNRPSLWGKQTSPSNKSFR